MTIGKHIMSKMWPSLMLYIDSNVTFMLFLYANLNSVENPTINTLLNNSKNVSFLI